MTKPLRQPARHARHERAGVVTRGSTSPEHAQKKSMDANGRYAVNRYCKKKEKYFGVVAFS
ncbi:MAG: hypothetical protein WBI57_06915 [Desulfobacterales bacterium]